MKQKIPGDKGAEDVTYIDSHLMPDETVASRKRLHWVIFLKPLVPGLIALGIIAFGTVLGSNVLALIGLGGLAIAGIWGGVVLVRYLSTEFAVTNKRLIRKEGVLSHSSRELHLSKLESVQVEQTLIGRMLGYGTMIVSGTGGLHHVFELIPRPLRFREAIQRQIEQYQQPDG
jgi:uncharacterized membrane protein YdbT with pleckstrin-like domain